MPVINPFPLNIPNKVNSPELLAFFQQFGIDKYLSAEEINKISIALQFLYENLGGGSLVQSGITTLGTFTIDGDEVTFTGYTWKINGVDYAQAAPITRTLPLASEGMYRTHTAYFTTTNDIQIAVGPESSEVTTEPNIPEGTLRLRAFNVFGDSITAGPGESLPYDINLLDLLMQNPASGDYLPINVGGIDYRVDFQRLITMFAGASSDTLADVMARGRRYIYDENNHAKFAFEGESGDEGFYVDFVTGSGAPVNTEGYWKAFQFLASNAFSTGFEFYNRKSYFFMSDTEGEPTSFDHFGPVFHKQIGSFVLQLHLANPTASGGKIVVPDTAGQTRTLATTQYVDDAIEGLKTKAPVRLATTETITLLGHQEIDGVLTVEGDRILVKDHSTASLNGIYIAKEDFWDRADDANTATELTNALVSVLEGDTNAQATFRQSTTSVVLDTSNIVWQPFGTQTPDATDTTKGKIFLYNSEGTEVNGAMTRGAVTASLNGIRDILSRKANNLVMYNRTAWFAQRGSQNFGAIGVTNGIFVVSGASAVTPTNTNGYTVQVRTKFSTGTTPGSLAYYRISIDAIIINTRFYIDCLFGFEGTTSDSRFVFGLTPASTANPTNVAPNSLTNILLISKIATSNNLHILHNDNSGTASSIDLGANFPCDTNQTDVYYAKMLVLTVGTVIYEVIRMNSDGVVTHTATGTITSDLPQDNVLLYHRAWVTNNASSADASFSIMGGSLGKI
jgi:hypothetical protein